MSRLLPLILLLVVGFIPRLNASALNRDDRWSVNRKYSVDLTSSENGKLTIAVFEHTKEAKPLRWAKIIDWEASYPFWTVQDVQGLVSDDGKFVILRDRATPVEMNGIRIVGKEDDDDHRIAAFNDDKLTLYRRDPSGKEPQLPPAVGVSYLHCTSIMDFVVPELDAYAIWFGQTDHWLLISLKDFKGSVVEDAGRIDFLSQLAHDRALELVLWHQPSPLKQALARLREKAGQLISSIGVQKTYGYMSTDVTAAYFFLAVRKDSGVKSYLEHLVTSPFNGIQAGHRHSGILDFSGMPGMQERVLGDYLLSRWNGETNTSFARETHVLVPDEPLKRLGSIHGNLKLPVDFRKNPGMLWAYLIPAKVPYGKWNESTEVIPYRIPLTDDGSSMNTVHVRDAEVSFKAVIPGEYRLKFIWERHANLNTWSAINYTNAAPGDFESIESPGFRVDAGVITRNLNFSCTNRIGDRDLYKED